MPILNLAMRQVRHVCVRRKKLSKSRLTTQLTHLTQFIGGIEWKCKGVCGGGWWLVGGVRESIETCARCVICVSASGSPRDAPRPTYQQPPTGTQNYPTATRRGAAPTTWRLPNLPGRTPRCVRAASGKGGSAMRPVSGLGLLRRWPEGSRMGRVTPHDYLEALALRQIRFRGAVQDGRRWWRETSEVPPGRCSACYLPPQGLTRTVMEI